MIRWETLTGSVRVVVMAIGVLCLLSGAPAVAQSVRGNGIIRDSHGAVDGGNFFKEVSVDAWLDETGCPHGMIAWRGERWQPLPQGDIRYGGPANTYFFEITAIYFYGNTAEVWGTVIASPDPIAYGYVGVFLFTDNQGTGGPDCLNFDPLDAGNYLVSP